MGGYNGMIDRMLDVVFGKSKITKPMFIKEFSKENRQLDQLLEIESSVIDKKNEKRYEGIFSFSRQVYKVNQM